jgi:hypothetical protein
VPQFTNGVRQRRDDVLQQSLVAERDQRALQRRLKQAVIQLLHGGEAGCLKNFRERERPSGGVRDAAVRLGGGDQRLEPRQRQIGDAADVVAGHRGQPQQREPLDLRVRIHPPVGAGAFGLHRAVALFPDAHDMRAQPGPPGDDAQRVTRFLHSRKLDKS